MVVDSISRQAGGILDGVRGLALQMRGQGDEVCIHGVADAHSSVDRALWNPLRVELAAGFGPHAFGYAPRLLRNLLEFAPTVVHSHGLWKYVSVAASRAARGLGSAHVVHPHGMLDEWALNHSRCKKQIARLLYEDACIRGSVCLRALNEGEALSIRRAGFRNPIAVIPNGIEAAPFSPSDSAKSASLFPGRRVLLYLGRIHPKKGLLNALGAWASIVRSGAAGDWIFVIAGWDQDSHLAELNACAATAGLDERHVRFLGPQFGDDKAALYFRCDAFILASLSEGLPMVVLEAWANSKAVLMTDRCNLPIGAEAGAALIVQPTPDALRAGMLALIAMPSHVRDAMGRAGRALIERRFSWAHVAGQMRSLDEWLMGGGERPGFVISEAR